MRDHEKLSLKDNPAYLMYVASRHLTKIYSDVLEKIGLSFIEYLIVKEMQNHESLYVSELVSILCIDHTSISIAAKSLCAKKILFKRQSKRDRRAVVLKFTEYGRSLKNVIEELERNISESIGAGEAELKNLNDSVRSFALKIINDCREDNEA